MTAAHPQAAPPHGAGRDNSLNLPHPREPYRQYESLSDLPCAGHPAGHYLVDDAHVTEAALDAIRAYMDAAQAAHLAEPGAGD